MGNPMKPCMMTGPRMMPGNMNALNGNDFKEK